MFLFILERAEESPSKSLGGVRKAEQRQRHQFGCKKFVICKKMEQPSAFLNAFKILCLRERSTRFAT